MKLVQVWVVCFVVFFGSAELYQWVQGITLPMPVFVIAGTLLAIASNADKFPRDKFPNKPPLTSPAASAASPTPAPAASSHHYPKAQLPNLSPHAPRSISFTIHSPQPTISEPTRIPHPMNDQTDRQD